MYNETFEKMNKLGKSGYDTIKELYEINMKIVNQLSEQQMAFVSLYIECTTSQFEMLDKSKDYKDVIGSQTTLINQASEKVQDIARNTVDIMNETKDDISAWVERGVEDASSIVPFAKTA